MPHNFYIAFLLLSTLSDLVPEDAPRVLKSAAEAENCTKGKADFTVGLIALFDLIERPFLKLEIF